MSVLREAKARVGEAFTLRETPPWTLPTRDRERERERVRKREIYLFKCAWQLHVYTHSREICTHSHTYSSDAHLSLWVSHIPGIPIPSRWNERPKSKRTNTEFGVWVKQCIKSGGCFFLVRRMISQCSVFGILSQNHYSRGFLVLVWILGVLMRLITAIFHAKNCQTKNLWEKLVGALRKSTSFV